MDKSISNESESNWFGKRGLVCVWMTYSRCGKRFLRLKMFEFQIEGWKRPKDESQHRSISVLQIEQQPSRQPAPDESFIWIISPGCVWFYLWYGPSPPFSQDPPNRFSGEERGDDDGERGQTKRIQLPMFGRSEICVLELGTTLRSLRIVGDPQSTASRGFQSEYPKKIRKKQNMIICKT